MTKEDRLYGKKLLDSIIEKHPEYNGQAYLLLAGLLSSLDMFAHSKEDKFPVEEEIKLLEVSVKAEPNWVTNHSRLADAYKRIGKFSEALEHYKKALGNFIEIDPTWSLTRYHFEEEITGRIHPSIKEGIPEEIKEISKHTNHQDDD